MIQIKRRSDGLYNVWREDFLNVDPDITKSPEVHNVRASRWQVIAVTETHDEALQAKKEAQR